MDEDFVCILSPGARRIVLHTYSHTKDIKLERGAASASAQAIAVFKTFRTALCSKLNPKSDLKTSLLLKSRFGLTVVLGQTDFI